MENVISEWLRCPVCGNKTRLKIRGDTELKYFPLFCPKCRQETLITDQNAVIGSFIFSRININTAMSTNFS